MSELRNSEFLRSQVLHTDAKTQKNMTILHIQSLKYVPYKHVGWTKIVHATEPREPLFKILLQNIL